MRRKVIARKVAYHGATWRALDHGHHSIRTPFEPLVDGVRHVANTNRYRCKYCAEAGGARSRAPTGGRDDRAGGPRDRRDGDHGAGPELGRHVHPAPGIPPPRARDLRRLRRPPGRRRGHLRLRPARRVVRLPALRLRARPDHVRQGSHQRLCVARRAADLRPRGRAVRRARRVLPARHHVRRPPDGDGDRERQSRRHGAPRPARERARQRGLLRRAAARAGGRPRDHRRRARRRLLHVARAREGPRDARDVQRAGVPGAAARVPLAAVRRPA